MAKAADFDGTANETEVIPPEKCRGKGRPSILSEKAYLWLLTINNPQDHGISLDQQDILERLKDDIAAGKIVYIIARMEQSLTTDENGKHTPHGHIAIRFAAQTRGGTVHKKFPMAALQNCNADTFSVRQYILKDPTGKWYKTHPEKIGERLPDSEANCWEWGQIPGSRKSKDNQSPKTLSEDIMRAIREGKNDADIYEFGILESNVHMAWMRAIGGRIKSDYRYSKDIVYNNFPWPTPTAQQKVRIEQTSQAILDARTLYPDSSLADLYDDLTMPLELRKAHQDNDRAVMDAYGFTKGTAARTSESACVAELMKLYQQKVSAAQSK